MNPITKAWAALVRLVRPDVDAIISTFLKAQQKLDQFITREEAIVADLATALRSKNAEIDRAYKLVHKFSELTA